MKALLYKEFLALKNYMIVLGVLGIGVLICSGVNLHVKEFTHSMFCMLSLIMAIAMQDSDVQYGWNSFVEALPLSKEQIVSSKFVLGLWALIPCVAMTVGSNIIRYFALPDPFQIGEIHYSVMTFAATFACAGVMLFIAFLFGKKALGVSSFAVGLSFGISSNLIESTEQGQSIYPSALDMVVTVAVSAAVYAVCWALTIYLYKKRGVK